MTVYAMEDGRWKVESGNLQIVKNHISSSSVKVRFKNLSVRIEKIAGLPTGAGKQGGKSNMGNYLNPGNMGFAGIKNDIYVDKSGLISLINGTIDTPRRLTCISRPRRFGKSFAAKMLCAYYDKTCDSAALFDDLEIAGDAQYREHLNRYDVIYVDMTEAIGGASITDVVPYIQRNVTRELTETYPDMKTAEGFAATLANAAEAAGNKFIMIIDEWDAPIREAAGRPDLQRKYLEFLRSLFKNSGMTDKIFAAAYRMY